MKRRKFILLAGISAGVIVVPPTLYFISPSVKKYAVGLVKKELNYLKLAKGSVENYVEDYFNANQNNLVSTLKWKTLYYLRMGVNDSSQLYELVKYYLLSSDFFIYKTDQNRTINYICLYNPYKSPVPNPFSFVLYPADKVADV